MKLFVILCLINCTFGSKLERWFHPEIEGSTQSEALSTARRNPKLFFGVSSRLKNSDLKWNNFKGTYGL